MGVILLTICARILSTAFMQFLLRPCETLSSKEKYHYGLSAKTIHTLGR